MCVHDATSLYNRLYNRTSGPVEQRVVRCKRVSNTVLVTLKQKWALHGIDALAIAQTPLLWFVAQRVVQQIEVVKFEHMQLKPLVELRSPDKRS